MSKITKYLILLLTFQFGVSAYLYLGKNSFSNYKTEQKLLELSLNDIDTVLLEERDKEPLELIKKEGQWVVSSSQDFPVGSDKLKILDDELFSLTRPYPVGNTLIAAKNFEAGDNSYKKKLVLKNGSEEKAVLFFGKSPGFKKVYARVEGEEKTYAVTLGSHNLQTDSQFWLDKELIKVNRSELSSIQMEDIVITLEDNKPIIKDIDEDQEMVEEKINSLIKDATRLTFSKLIENPKDFDDYVREMKYTISLENNKNIEFDIRKNNEDEPKFFLKRSDYPYVVNITKYQVENLKKYKKSDLLKSRSEASDKPIEESKETVN